MLNESLITTKCYLLLMTSFMTTPSERRTCDNAARWSQNSICCVTSRHVKTRHTRHVACGVTSVSRLSCV